MEQKQFKTPEYVRKSVKAYYSRVKSDPVKYQDYCDKRASYQKSYYYKKQMKIFRDKYENCEEEKKTYFENKIKYYQDKYDENEKIRSN